MIRVAVVAQAKYVMSYEFKIVILFFTNLVCSQTILSQMKHIDKSRIYDILLPWFNTGLLTSGGNAN
jgi:hypothetical protein